MEKTFTKECVVTPELLATAVGSGSVEVFATPMVAALLEGAAAELAQKELQDGWTTVGSQISIEHLCPTVAGVKVTATATLTEVDGRMYRFTLEAKDNAGVIARGTHERVLSLIHISGGTGAGYAGKYAKKQCIKRLL